MRFFIIFILFLFQTKISFSLDPLILSNEILNFDIYKTIYKKKYQKIKYDLGLQAIDKIPKNYFKIFTDIKNNKKFVAKFDNIISCDSKEYLDNYYVKIENEANTLTRQLDSDILDCNIKYVNQANRKHISINQKFQLSECILNLEEKFLENILEFSNQNIGENCQILEEQSYEILEILDDILKIKLENSKEVFIEKKILINNISDQKFQANDTRFGKYARQLEYEQRLKNKLNPNNQYKRSGSNANLTTGSFFTFFNLVNPIIYHHKTIDTTSNGSNLTNSVISNSTVLSSPIRDF